MDQDQATDFYNQLVELYNAGKEADAQALLQQHFAELPEETQGQILAMLYANVVVEEGEQAEVVNAIRENGAQALENLANMEKNGQSGQLDKQ